MLSDILKRQFATEEALPPYTYHWTDAVIGYEDGRASFTVRLKGIPFEVISDNILEHQFDAWNELLLNLGKQKGSRFAVWGHLDHYRTTFKRDYKFNYKWLNDFSKEYMKRFERADVFENDYYLTFILKPGMNDSIKDTIAEIEEVKLQVLQTLKTYDVELLTLYEHNGHKFSEVYEFLGYLCNGFWERIPVTSLPLQQAIQTSTLHHGYKLIETRFPDGGNRFSTLFDLKDFPEPTTRGMFNPLLELRVPFVLCVSFTYVNLHESIRDINQALNKFESAGDEATNQMDDMDEGKKALMSGEIYFGVLHSALMVSGASEKQAEERGGMARSLLSSSCGSLYLPATIHAPETFFSIFPGNIKRRPRVMPKTTRNFAGIFSINNYSSGKQNGNPLGDGSAVIPMQTSVDGVYHFNFHFSRPDVDSRGEKKAGHTLVCGTTGSGKTTLQAKIVAYLDRFNAGMFGVDKEGSMKGLFEALGGTYLKLAAGEPTGIALFQMPDCEYTRTFLYETVLSCGKKQEVDPTSEDLKDIKLSVDAIMSMPFEVRRFGLLPQLIPDRGENCLRRRLEDWCYGEIDGRYAYVFDNPKNDFDWENFYRIAFDVSDFLKAGNRASEPILAFLLHIKSLIVKRHGGLFVSIVEECWLPLQFSTTAAHIVDVLNTGRRRDEFIILVTQNPAQLLRSQYLPEILEQTATKIFLPSPDSEYEAFRRFNFTPKEFVKFKKLQAHSRQCLLKQGSQSQIVKMDLSGMEDQIAVLAMAAEDFPIFEAAKKEAGAHPDSWVPRFVEMRRLEKESKKHAEKELSL